MIKPGLSGCKVLVANYHAPKEENLKGSVEQLKKFGVTNVILQEDIFDAGLFFRLLTLSKMGDLQRMTQFKSANPEDRTGQLITYPVLMTHDIAGFEEVMVGEDQGQHLEYAKKLLRKHNVEFGSNFPVPKANVLGGRIKDLRDPSKKMSKSSPLGCLFLDDPKDVIYQKIRKATADEAGIENLKVLYDEFVGDEVPVSNQLLKERLVEGIVERFIC